MSFFLDLSAGEQFPLMRVFPSTGHEAAKGAGGCPSSSRNSLFSMEHVAATGQVCMERKFLDKMIFF